MKHTLTSRILLAGFVLTILFMASRSEADPHVRYIGEKYLGGVIIWLDCTPLGQPQQGLIAALKDQQPGTGFTWIAAQTECTGVGPGWRLPTKDELHRIGCMMWGRPGGVVKDLHASPPQTPGIDLTYYWSSTTSNVSSNYAFKGLMHHAWSSGVTVTELKTKLLRVRAVKSF